LRPRDRRFSIPDRSECACRGERRAGPAAITGRGQATLGSDVETDGALIEQSVRGRADAFVEVVQRHEVAVHGFLARRAGQQGADDLLGEVWVRAFAGRGGYDPGHADARPWLYGIARNVLRAHWRSRPDTSAAAEEAIDPWDDVIARLDSAAQARELISALQ